MKIDISNVTSRWLRMPHAEVVFLNADSSRFEDQGDDHGHSLHLGNVIFKIAEEDAKGLRIPEVIHDAESDLDIYSQRSLIRAK